MYIDFAVQENVKIRLRRRRRALNSYRRNKTAVRARIPIVILTICLITGLTGYIGIQSGSSSNTGLAFSAHAEEKVIYKNVVVKSGDTIWGIASNYVDPSKDIRKYVKEICVFNDIKPGYIYPGQVIVVPVKAYLA
jgi:LysM repeat protein